MAAVDELRRRAKLDLDELAAAITLASGTVRGALTDSAGVASAGLAESGATVDGELAGWLAQLLEPAIDPEWHATAEIVLQRRLVVVAQAWRSGSRCTLGRLGADGMVELAPIEPSMIPAALALEVGLGPRPDATGRNPITVPVEEFGSHGEELLGPLAGRPSRRISAATPTGGESIGVVDGGEEGWWVTELRTGANGDGGGVGEAIALMPIGGDDLAARLTGLFA
jgi:hypothetical protein